MEKWNFYLFVFSFFLNSYILSMELASKKKSSPIKSTLSTVGTHNTINTIEDLAKFVHEKKGVFTDEDLDENDINPDLAGKLIVSLGLEYDGQLPMHGSFIKSVRSLPKKDANLSRRLKKTLFEQAYVHDGKLTAGSITQRKKDIWTASSCTTSGKTTSGKISIAEEKEKVKSGTDLSKKLHLNMEDIKKQQVKDKKNNGNLYDEDLEKAKQEMRELILAAADDAIKDKDWESRRNLYVGAGSTIIAAVAGPLITYFTTQSDCPSASNSTSI